MKRVAPRARNPARPQTGGSLFARDLLSIILLISFCLCLGLPRFRTGINSRDEGFLACGAERVMAGQVPHRDFVSLQPPLSFYTSAAFFKLFGTSLVSLRIFGIGLYTFIPLIIYGIARNLVGPALSLAAALPMVVLGMPFFNFVPYAVWQGITATLAAVFLYLRATTAGRRFLALPAGVMTATSILSRHDQGLYLAVSILVYTMAMKYAKGGRLDRAGLKTAFTFWLAGMASVILPSMMYWWEQGALPQMFQQLIVFPATTYAKTSSLPFPAYDAMVAFSVNAVLGLYYLPPAIEVLLAIQLTRQILHRGLHVREAVRLLLLVWSGLFFCQVLTRSDLYHLLITLPPFFILLACSWPDIREGIARMTEKIRPPRPGPGITPRSISIGAGIAAAAFLWMTHEVFLPDRSKQDELLALSRAGVRVGDAQKWVGFVRFVHDCVPADRSMLCLPYEPLFYFLCERRNPTRWNYLWPGDQTAEDQAGLIRQAKSDPPALVVIVDEETMTNFAPAVLDYVHQEFQLVKQVGPMTIYLPIPAQSRSMDQ